MTSPAGQLDLRGGHPAIDFVNTVAWRGDDARRIDHLGDYADAIAWCRHAGVVSSREASELIRAARADVSTAAHALTRAKRLRESLHALWIDGAQPAFDAVAAAYADALRHRRLCPVERHVTWIDRQLAVRTPFDRLAVAAVDLLTEVTFDQVRRCDDSACGWLFLDNSHRQNRRWCSSADCGNRDRARRHYGRARR
ncbi:hypothetical protein A5724_16045 [Mycobacterium sp. ACS1612]|uniref:CGNR zinc finger domain-containing protein n=1 Tax=Mycobacterium sp. ACS1612 TaxID=1834117 RepID=UPI000800BA5A|nr:ABATE domain-containing protein [Mycobacterium sp. ACS1612]OBF34887.1 hypothetical protein A5724_16045 [Mycobacterium sp. ACS1612]